MNHIDPTKSHVRQKIPAGTVFALQGSFDKTFIILHSGMAEVLSFDGSADTRPPGEIVERSIRIGFIKGESLLGFMGIMQEDRPNEFTLRSMTECTVSIKPMSFEDLTKKLHQDTALNLRIHRSLLTHAEAASYVFRNLKYLWHKFASIADSLALGAKWPEENAPTTASREESSFREYSAWLKNKARDTRGAAPKEWDYNIFLGRIQNKLDLYADQDRNLMERHVDMGQYMFIKRLLRKKDDIIEAVMAQDEPLNRYILDFLSSTVSLMFRANRDVVEEIRTLAEILYSDGGWAEQVEALQKGESPKTTNFLHFLAKFSFRCRKDTINLLGMDLIAAYPAFEKLRRFSEFKGPEIASPIPVPAAGDRLGKYSGLLDKLLSFGDLPDDLRDEFRTYMDELVDGRGPESYERLNELYWMLYERCFLKIVGTDLKSFIPGIMLHIGLVDERLLSEDELVGVDACYSSTLYTDVDIPVMTLPYFLEKIYKGDVLPSITEMGDTFAFVLKSQEKLSPRDRKTTYIYKDIHDDRVRFELRSVAKEVQGMLFGNRKKALPFLTSDHLHGNPGRMFAEPEKLVGIVKGYRDRDFTLFHREYQVKNPLGADFIQGEVIPNFVIYPGFGNRGVMWQEMGQNKKIPGRLFFPAYFPEKIEEEVLEQLAYFRWELQKTVAGHNWTDPVEGGLVGAYYDYINFYKKNPAIGSEAKTRLRDFIKRTKSDKDRFAQEYRLWVEFEYGGMMKLNGAAREIFFRHCPFPAAVRDQMSRKPAFSTMAVRFANNRQKEMKKIQSRILKYERAGKTVPENLLEYMKFLDH